MLLPCYHHHYSSRVAGPRDRETINPVHIHWALIWQKYKPTRWVVRNKKNVQTEKKNSPCNRSASWVWQPADVPKEPQRRKSPLPPGQQLDSGAAAAMLSETTVCRMWGRKHELSCRPRSKSCHFITLMTVSFACMIIRHKRKWKSKQQTTLLLINKTKSLHWRTRLLQGIRKREREKRHWS